MNCKNCEQELLGTYCSNCGQHGKVARVTAKSISSDLSSGLFQVDRGFFYTLKGLTLHPGRSIRAYLAGKRKRHFKPVAYVIVLSTVYFLVASWTGQETWISDVITGLLEGGFDGSSKGEVAKVGAWISSHHAYSTLLLLPVFSLATYIGFRRHSLNYAEHLVLNAYVSGQQAIVYACMAILTFGTGGYYLEALGVFISISYAYWVYVQVFSKGNIFGRILRTTVAYLLYGLLAILVLAVGYSIWPGSV